MLPPFTAWLFRTDHISVSYGLEFDRVPIERLSPRTRGIVLLLLDLAVDAQDEHPLIVYQPEENVDPKSIYAERSSSPATRTSWSIRTRTR